MMRRGALGGIDVFGWDWTTSISAAIGAIGGVTLKELLPWLVRRGQKLENERDALVVEIVQTISDIRNLSDEYWISDAQSLADREWQVSAHLVASLHHLSFLISVLFAGNDAKRSCDVANVGLMKLVTGGDFKTTGRQATPEILPSIHTKSLDLLHQVRKSRAKLPRAFGLY